MEDTHPEQPTISVTAELGCGCEGQTLHPQPIKDTETRDLLRALKESFSNPLMHSLLTNMGCGHEGGGVDRLVITVERGVYSDFHSEEFNGI